MRTTMSVSTVSGITNTKHHQAVRPQRGVADRIEDERIPNVPGVDAAVQGLPSQAS